MNNITPVISHVVVSMAGMGTRLGKNCPKGLVDIREHKLVYYLLQCVENIPDVRIVVGFHAQDVIDYVKSVRSDVNFVLNSDYETTTCAYSINLGCCDLPDPYLIVDGDLLLNRHSFNQFVEACKSGNTLVGITPAKTEQSVFVDIDESLQMIKGFTRQPVSKWEWSGVAFVNGFHIEKSERFICDTLAKKLPLRYQPIECFEIDTPADYQLALDNFEMLGY